MQKLNSSEEDDEDRNKNMMIPNCIGKEEDDSVSAPSGSSRCSMDPMTFDEVHAGTTWVLVKYEEETFIGKVMKKGVEPHYGIMKECYYVRCLECPYGVNIPQQYEHGDPIMYNEVFKTSIVPTQTQFNAEGQKTRRFFWVY